jgi:3-oxoacyl-[acyl-carrier protein] reductase
MQVDLNDKVALVTGAGRGIGNVIAGILADNGATVIYTDRDAAVLEGMDALPDRCRRAVLDVTDATQIATTIDSIERIEGRLDILVNNAGINTLAHRVPLDEFPLDEWDRIVAVDMTGVYKVSQGAARLLLKDGGGRIINISSVLGLVPARLQCAYVAAKAGVINLTRAMALEFGGRGVLVNAIAPGSIETDSTRALFYGEDGLFKSSVQEMLAHIPLGRPGVPREIAYAALFLAAPESSYINGHVLTVDGGWTAGYLRPF